MTDVRIILSGNDTLVSRFKDAPARLISFLKQGMTDFALALREEAVQKAGSKSGRLGSSIEASVYAGETFVSIMLGTQGVPYARIQELGGDIPGHPIYAKGKALAFYWPKSFNKSGLGIYQSVNWPGAHIPAKHYISGTMRQRKQDFIRIVNEAIAATAGHG
jgi:hypothetical protein